MARNPFLTMLAGALLTCVALQADAASTKIETHSTTVCHTYKTSGGKTSTKFVDPHTCEITKTVRPLATTTKTLTPKHTNTVTQVVVSLATATVNAPQTTDTVTSTSTSFAVEVPTLTVFAPTFTPTITSYSLVPGATSTFTVTSFDGPTPSPSLQYAVVRSEPTERPHPRAKKNGKNVVCTVETKISTLIQKPATCTSTTVTWLPRQVSTITSTATATQTITQYPQAAKYTVVEGASLTITAQPITTSVTPTAAPSVTVSLLQEEPATAVDLVHIYSHCQPSGGQSYYGSFLISAPVAYDSNSQVTLLDNFQGSAIANSIDCCRAAVDITAAVAYWWQESTQTCKVTRPADSITDFNAFCSNTQSGTIAAYERSDSNDWTGSLLQCGRYYSSR